jgi:hypothetical protein
MFSLVSRQPFWLPQAWFQMTHSLAGVVAAAAVEGSTVAASMEVPYMLVASTAEWEAAIAWREARVQRTP